MTGADDPERALALSYMAADRRAGVAALLALDETLGQVLRTTREPMVGQMRLTWWHTALTALDTAPPPAQPVLQALAAEVLPHGVSGAALAEMVEAWEALLDPDPLDAARLEDYAGGRGAALFGMAGRVLGADPRDPLARAGEGWALADLAAHMRDPIVAEHARTRARVALGEAMARVWRTRGRGLGAMAHGARMDVALPVVASRAGSPGRVARLAWHRLTGR